MDTNINILVVEDSEFQSEIFIFYLKGMGFNKITQAGNGAEAFALLEKDSYDLIISDWEMPEMNGLELLKKVKETPDYQNIPFIMITILEDENSNREAMDAGASDFIVKPANPDIIREKLETIFTG
jgi:PleD family two-component response regulator